MLFKKTKQKKKSDPFINSKPTVNFYRVKYLYTYDLIYLYGRLNLHHYLKKTICYF